MFTPKEYTNNFKDYIDYLFEKNTPVAPNTPKHKEEETGKPEIPNATPTEKLPDAGKELMDMIKDMTDEEKETLLAYAYALIFDNPECENCEDGDEEEDEEGEEDEEEGGDEEGLKEAAVKHLDPTQRLKMQILRRTPKWKRKMKIRYIKGKQCPPGTTYSSKTKSCTPKNIAFGRMQMVLAKSRLKH